MTEEVTRQFLEEIILNLKTIAGLNFINSFGLIVALVCIVWLVGKVSEKK